MDLIHSSARERRDFLARSLRPHKTLVVFFALISVLAGLITIECLKGLAGGALPVKQWGILMVVVSAMVSTMAWSHFNQRNRQLIDGCRHDAERPEDAEESAQRALLAQIPTAAFRLSGDSKTDAAALSHYLHEMNSELVKSVSSSISDRPQERKLLGD